MIATIGYLASPKFLANFLVQSLSPQRFDHQIHGGRFFSHSMKSPLTTLKVCLSELAEIVEQSENRQIKKYLESATVATKQIASLIEVAMTLGAYERAHHIRVAEFISQLKTLYVVKDKSRKINYCLNLYSGCETVKMNKYFLFELLQCLLNNAFEAYDKKCRNKVVTLTVVAKAKKLEIQVQDFGRGNNYLSTKLMTTKGYSTKGDGRGFGLWFVNEVVRAHGNKLSISSTKEGGTIVRFSLPLE